MTKVKAGILLGIFAVGSLYVPSGYAAEAKKKKYIKAPNCNTNPPKCSVAMVSEQPIANSAGTTRSARISGGIAVQRDAMTSKQIDKRFPDSKMEHGCYDGIGVYLVPMESACPKGEVDVWVVS